MTLIIITDTFGLFIKNKFYNKASVDKKKQDISSIHHKNTSGVIRKAVFANRELGIQRSFSTHVLADILSVSIFTFVPLGAPKILWIIKRDRMNPMNSLTFWNFE